MCNLYSTGIYLSAISVSEDVKLRQSVREFAIINQSRLVDNIGMAHMESEIVRTVLKIGLEALTQQTGVEPSLTEERCCSYHGYGTSYLHTYIQVCYARWQENPLKQISTLPYLSIFVYHFLFGNTS